MCQRHVLIVQNRTEQNRIEQIKKENKLVYMHLYIFVYLNNTTVNLKKKKKRYSHLEPNRRPSISILYLLGLQVPQKQSQKLI
jgi:hypothetical protein